MEWLGLASHLGATSGLAAEAYRVRRVNGWEENVLRPVIGQGILSYQLSMSAREKGSPVSCQTFPISALPPFGVDASYLDMSLHWVHCTTDVHWQMSCCQQSHQYSVGGPNCRDLYKAERCTWPCATLMVGIAECPNIVWADQHIIMATGKNMKARCTALNYTWYVLTLGRAILHPSCKRCV